MTWNPNRLRAVIGIGNSGEDPARRCVNRIEFNQGGGGWPQLLDTRILPTIALGAVPVIANPAGEVPGPQQAEAFIEAAHAGLPLMADTVAFVKAIRAACAVAGQPVIVYMGGVFSSRYIHAGTTFKAKLRRARQCYQPVLDSGAILALDGDSEAQTNTDNARIIDALSVMQADPTTPQIIEAIWGIHGSWAYDRPCVIIDGTYRRWKAEGWATHGVIDPASNPQHSRVSRIIDAAGETWLSDASKAAQSVWADGHDVWVTADPFVDNRVRFEALAAPVATTAGEVTMSA